MECDNLYGSILLYAKYMEGTNRMGFIFWKALNVFG